MTEKIIYTLKGKDTGGRRYIATDGRELAEYCPQKEEVRKPDKFGRERIVQGLIQSTSQSTQTD
jgi:hypothetical protein